jgi:hypothetical protein
MKRDDLIEGEVYCYTHYRSRHRDLADVYSPEPWTFVGIDGDGDLRFAANDPETLVVTAKVATFSARYVLATWSAYKAAKAVADVRRTVMNRHDKTAKAATERIVSEVTAALGVSGVKLGYGPRRGISERTLIDSNTISLSLADVQTLLARLDSTIDLPAALRAVLTTWTDEDAVIEREKAALTGAPVPVV